MKLCSVISRIKCVGKACRNLEKKFCRYNFPVSVLGRSPVKINTQGTA